MIPKVSVIIPNYNHAPYLRQRINSVLNQKFRELEVIVLDDQSTDNSLSVIEEFRLDPRLIQLIYNEHNSGSTFKQWNKGIGLCSADIIWIAESDDFADESFLSTLMPGMLAREEIGIAYCQSFKVNSNNEVTGTWKEDTDGLNATIFASDFEMNGKAYIKQFLIHRNTIPNASGVVFRKRHYQLAGGAEADIKNCSDWLTWLKVLMISDVMYLAKPLNYFRYHNQSVIAIAEKNMDFNSYIERFDRTMRNRFQEYLKTNHKKEVEIANVNADYILKEHGDEGLYEVGNKWLFKGWKHLIKSLKFTNRNFLYIKQGLGQSIKQIIRI